MGGTGTPTQVGDAFDPTHLHGAFLEEAADSVAQLEGLLLAVGAAEPAEPDDETLNAIFRLAHSLKGGAAAFGLGDVAALAHAMETLLGRLRRRELALGPETVDTLLSCVDALNGLLAQRQCSGGQEIDCAVLLRRLDALASADDPRGAARAGADRAAARRLELAIGPLEGPSAADGIVELFAEIAGLGRCEPADGGVAGADGLRRFRVETGVGDRELLDLLAFHVPRDRVRIVPDRAPTPAPTALARTTMRVPVERIDRLIVLVDALLATQASLARAGRELDPSARRALDAGLAALANDAGRLREAVTALRTVTAASAFARFPRLLRDLGNRLGKALALRTLGDDTELDTALAERLVDPLMHLVRNAADHGIEPAAERLARGKPVTGTVTLAASRCDGELVVEVSDDGRGLDRAALLRKAAERGLALDDRASDPQVWSLILEPGFTTAAEVTDVSGRGVGMDVVGRAVDALGGSLAIDSRAGQGVCVSLRLPLRLPSAATAGAEPAREPGARAGIDAPVRDYLVVALAGQEYGIDAMAVQELRGLEPATPMAGAPAFVRGRIDVRGVPVPLIDLRLALGLPWADRDASTAVLVLALGPGPVAIVVDGVSDVVALEPERLRPPPPVETGRDMGRDMGFVTGLAELPGRMLILVDVERLPGIPALALDVLPA